jgi:hypothetical protein
MGAATITSCLRGAALAALLCAAAAHAQPHQNTAHGYTLRASVVSSMDLAESTARKHGIDRSPVHGVLNVTLMKGEGSAAPTLPAQVEARITGLYGAHHSVQLNEERALGRVSYYGSFRHEPREVLDFEITARPQAGGPRVVLGFRERMGRPEAR